MKNYDLEEMIHTYLESTYPDFHYNDQIHHIEEILNGYKVRFEYFNSNLRNRISGTIEISMTDILVWIFNKLSNLKIDF